MVYWEVLLYMSRTISEKLGIWNKIAGKEDMPETRFILQRLDLKLQEAEKIKLEDLSAN